MNKEKLKIRIKYVSKEIDHISKIDKGNWIDLRIAEPIDLKAGESAKISLGIAIQLPEGYEAHVLPRSSAFDKYGLIMGNSEGLIDTSYCGDNDVWRNLWYATKDVHIPINTRLSQFKIEEVMPELEVEEVENLGNPDRGGYGSTGTDKILAEHTKI